MLASWGRLKQGFSFAHGDSGGGGRPVISCFLRAFQGHRVALASLLPLRLLSLTTGEGKQNWQEVWVGGGGGDWTLIWSLLPFDSMEFFYTSFILILAALLSQCWSERSWNLLLCWGGCSAVREGTSNVCKPPPTDVDVTFWFPAWSFSVAVVQSTVQCACMFVCVCVWEERKPSLVQKLCSNTESCQIEEGGWEGRKGIDFILFFSVILCVCACVCVCLCVYLKSWTMLNAWRKCHLQKDDVRKIFSVSENHHKQCTIPRAAKQLPDRARWGEGRKLE